MFNHYLLDSNILIGFLNGNKKIIEWVLSRKKTSTTLAVSFITSIEILSLREAQDSELENLERFLSTFYRISVDEEIIKLASALRRKGVLALGDSIVAATAISRKYILVTNDKVLAKKAGKFVEVVSV